MSARLLVLTRRSEGSEARKAFKLAAEPGESGYVLKSDPPEQIARTIRSVMAGERRLSMHVPRYFVEEGVSTPQKGQAGRKLRLGQHW